MPIAAQLLIEPLRCDAIEDSQISIEHDSMPAEYEDPIFYELNSFKVAFCDLELHRFRHRLLLSHPEIPIQRSILDGLGKMFWGEIVFTGQVGYGSCNFENAIVSAGGEAKLRDGVLHDRSE